MQTENEMAEVVGGRIRHRGDGHAAGSITLGPKDSLIGKLTFDGEVRVPWLTWQIVEPDLMFRERALNDYSIESRVGSQKLLDFIAVLEQALGRTAGREMLPMQPGDVPSTYADIETAQRDLGYDPKTPIAEGVPHFVAWYRRYHGVD